LIDQWLHSVQSSSNLGKTLKPSTGTLDGPQIATLKPSGRFSRRGEISMQQPNNHQFNVALIAVCILFVYILRDFWSSNQEQTIQMITLQSTMVAYQATATANALKPPVALPTPIPTRVTSIKYASADLSTYDTLDESSTRQRQPTEWDKVQTTDASTDATLAIIIGIVLGAGCISLGAIFIVMRIEKTHTQQMAQAKLDLQSAIASANREARWRQQVQLSIVAQTQPQDPRPQATAQRATPRQRTTQGTTN
jgi:hypothetical protein